VRGIFSEGFKDPAYDLSWVASKAKISHAGDLGYTVGTYEFTFTGPGGKPVNDRGSYVAVWEKQPRSGWKVVVDIYNSDQPAASE
jgi:ketosteroid isomerase-like protein